jgi:hypothetical protein
VLRQSTESGNPTRTGAIVWLSAATLVAATVGMAACNRGGKAGHVLDEPARVHYPLSQLKAADEDYFHDMDNGIALSKEEVEGRNTWIVWTGGNDYFWDRISVNSVGTFDLLKVISSHRGSKYTRANRFYELGLSNEPCFSQATAPDPNRYGLWLDVRDPSCPPDPFANATKYPGVKLGARGTTVPVGSYYGEPTGIVGLRLFPNPEFDEKARRAWDADRYYNDPTYYFQKDLVKPYRVGMSCAFCHVGPNPIKPPDDPEKPKWENLSSNVGAQYFWVDRIFNWQGDTNSGSFFYQLFHTSRPGSLDTSLVSTDNINNPRTMNAVYMVKARLLHSKRWAKETLAGGELNNKQFNDYPGTNGLSELFKKPDTVWTPRVLKDGSDSVGALGALNRVYLNIGLFSEEWLLHFRPIIGGEKISPIPIATAQKNSVYWQATEQQTPNMALFFLKATDPHKLADAPGGKAELAKDESLVPRGKIVFAETCARCHSSKIPDLPKDIDLENANGKDYLTHWNKYWAFTKTDEFKTKMREMVQKDDFLTDNYLSTELRVPSTLMQTNICSPIATNAIKNNIWDNFSSQSYKSLPSVGTMKVVNPMTGEESDFTLPGGGRGFTRPASLISVWSTAPFLQNNALGRFNPSPSVEARLASFQDSIEQLLWPEKRRKDEIFANKTGPGVGVIDRTTVDSALYVPRGYIPGFLSGLLDITGKLHPELVKDGGVYIGPIPKGFPVSLLANADISGADMEFGSAEKKEHDRKLLRLLLDLQKELNAHNDIFKSPAIVNGLLSLSKCPDFVVNKGHYFGTSLQADEAATALSDSDKRALIAFLKTL